MEGFFKKIKEFEEVVTGSNKYLEDKIKKFGLDGLNKYNPYKYNSDDNTEYEEENKYAEDNTCLKEGNDDSVEYVNKKECIGYDNDEIFPNGFDLREAMIAKEILDKPLCKRRRRGIRGGR